MSVLRPLYPAPSLAPGSFRPPSNFFSVLSAPFSVRSALNPNEVKRRRFDPAERHCFFHQSLAWPELRGATGHQPLSSVFSRSCALFRRNRVSDKDTSPERAQRVEGSLFAAKSFVSHSCALFSCKSFACHSYAFLRGGRGMFASPDAAKSHAISARFRPAMKCQPSLFLAAVPFPGGAPSALH